MTNLISLVTGSSFDTSIQIVKERQMLIHNVPGGENEAVIYKVIPQGNSFMYQIIDCIMKQIYDVTIINPLSQKFGIGTYYDDTKEEFMDESEFNELVELVLDKKKKEEEKKGVSKAGKKQVNKNRK